jgi:hypothetical protein
VKVEGSRSSTEDSDDSLGGKNKGKPDGRKMEKEKLKVKTKSTPIDYAI